MPFWGSGEAQKPPGTPRAYPPVPPPLAPRSLELGSAAHAGSAPMAEASAPPLPVAEYEQYGLPPPAPAVQRAQQAPRGAESSPLPPGKALVAVPTIEAQPWVKELWSKLAAKTVGVARVDLRRPTFLWPEDYDAGSILFRRGRHEARRGRGRPRKQQPVVGYVGDYDGPYYPANAAAAAQQQQPGAPAPYRQQPTGARLKVTRCVQLKAPDSKRALLDFGVGVGVDLDRQELHGVARLKVADLLSLKLLPQPLLKVGGAWPLPVGGGMALRVKYEVPLTRLGEFWQPPARLMVRLDNDVGTGVHLTPTGVEFDERRLTLGKSTEVRAGATLRFPRSLPVDRDDPDAFKLHVHRLSLKTLWPAEDRKGVKEVLVEMTKTARAAVAHKIPVTIITGFLGAGKTTLLNYILKARGEKNISVIENEFGEVNIDNELVADNLIEKEDLVSLDNGCVCCSLRKDIVKALAEIERRSKHRSKRVDQVILETTGLADPAPVAFTFFANPWIVSRYRLDSIVCVVDTRYVMQHLEEDSAGGINEIAQQLAFSDLILLNKTDLVDAEQLDVVKGAVRRINQSAQLVECRLNVEGAAPPLSLLLENNSFSVNKALQVDPEFLHSDSGSDLDDSDSDSDDSDSGSGGGDDSPGHNAAAGDAPGEAEGSAAQQHAAGCCGGSGRPGKRQKVEQQQQQQQQQQQDGDADAARRESGQQAESSLQTSQTRCGGRWGQQSMADDSAAALTKGERRPKRRRKQLHDLSGVGSVGIVARGPLDEYRFNMFMRDLLAEKAKDIFRCKGVLAVHGYGNQRFVFQGVHETICYGPSDKPWADNETRINQIVFIGRRLDRKALMEGFRTCVWSRLPDGWQEYHDPVTLQPYYYNPNTNQKTWARPVDQPVCPSAVTATRLTSMEQPRSLQPGAKRRGASANGGNGSGSGGGAQGSGGGAAQAHSSSSTLSGLPAAAGGGAAAPATAPAAAPAAAAAGGDA
ncbi:Cbwd1 [Scenedesmus sp. PABB004]|nr:Cbwd1 [Scenedesmus sp. PABB004]